MNTEQKKRLANLRKALLHADMQSMREKYETDPHFRAIADKSVQAIFKKCEVRKKQTDNVQVDTNEIQEPKNQSDLTQIENLRSYLQQLTDISEDQARELADLSNQTLSSSRSIAEEAPICEMGKTDWRCFQLPLGIYFREICLPENLVKPWSRAGLSFQRRTDGLRLLLQSAPANLALAISIDSNRKITLDEFDCSAIIPYDESEEIDHLRIGIFPFRTNRD